ncbi:MAG: acylphosphatase [Bacteroidetes bacterium]|nr:acylphosphatase [Bacteroidota bacterium]
MILKKKKLTHYSNQNECVEIIVSGSVQGVYFRKFTKEIASKLEIKGWVKNLENGSVLINACGEKQNLELFIQKCKEGNLWSKVTEVNVRPITISKPFKSYEIVRK